MFELSISDELHTDEDGSFYHGLIQIDDFEERFVVMSDHWKPRDYRAHWISQGEKLLRVSDRVAMLKSVPGPNVDGCAAWVLWREGSVVFIHDQNIWRYYMGQVRDLSNPDRFIEDRETIADDGEQMSEWTVCITDIEEFVQRQTAAHRLTIGSSDRGG